jgi:hypothetical protein
LCPQLHGVHLETDCSTGSTSTSFPIGSLPIGGHLSDSPFTRDWCTKYQQGGISTGFQIRPTRNPIQPVSSIKFHDPGRHRVQVDAGADRQQCLLIKRQYELRPCSTSTGGKS